MQSSSAKSQHLRPAITGWHACRFSTPQNRIDRDLPLWRGRGTIRAAGPFEIVGEAAKGFEASDLVRPESTEAGLGNEDCLATAMSDSIDLPKREERKRQEWKTY